MRIIRLVFVLSIACFSHLSQADVLSAPPLFDPSRHMRVSEVRPGMAGYGLTVFSGDKIEKFDVVVIDIVKDFNPKYDVVLIRCKGEYLEHTGAIAGMSGSPIFLYDDTGRARMIGAFAYGWSLSKDPIAGVQPIEYMLSLPRNSPAATAPSPANDRTAAQQKAASPSSAANGAMGDTAVVPHWSMDDVTLQGWDIDGQRGDGARPARSGLARPQADLLDRPGIHLTPLATPLMVSGMNARTLERVMPLFEKSGLVPMQAGSASGGGGAAGTTQPSNAGFTPGSVLAIPLITGDMDVSAIGTCTEVLGDRVFGFGHSMFGEGKIALPVGTGYIATVIPNLESSFKLGVFGKTIGTLTADQTVGVAGLNGMPAPMVPIDVRIVYDDKSIDKTYHFNVALHPKLTAVLAMLAMDSVITGERELPQYHTVDYDMTLDFANGQSVHLANRSVNSAAAQLANDLALPINVASDNPFRRVPLTRLSGTLRVASDADSGEIQSIMVPRSKYEPGETVKAYVSYQPFRAREGAFPVELELPRDLPNGTYHLIVSDWQRYYRDERLTNAFKFGADNIDEVFSVVKDVMSIQHNAVYLRLIRKADGVAVGRTALAKLPSGYRQVLLDSGRSDITPFVSSTVKVVPTQLVMTGSADFAITIERQGKVEVAMPNAPKAESAPPAVPKSDDSKPSSGK